MPLRCDGVESYSGRFGMVPRLKHAAPPPPITESVLLPTRSQPPLSEPAEQDSAFGDASARLSFFSAPVATSSAPMSFHVLVTTPVAAKTINRKNVPIDGTLAGDDIPQLPSLSHGLLHRLRCRVRGREVPCQVAPLPTFAFRRCATVPLLLELSYRTQLSPGPDA